MDSVCDELGIPKQHIQECANNKNRCILIASKEWIKCLEQMKKICNFQVHDGLDKNHISTMKNLGHHWIKCYMHIYKKQNNQNNVIPLLKYRGELITNSNNYNNNNNNNNDYPLIFSQILSFISLNNYKNLWSNAYKKYDGAHKNFINNKNNGRKYNIGGLRNHNENDIDLIPYDTILRDLIQNIYRCSIIHSKLDRLKSIEMLKTTSNSFTKKLENDCHQNLLSAIIAIETSTHFVVIFYPSKYDITLYDCITYSPAILNKSHNKPMFIIYQIFQLVKYFHDIGLMIGDIRLQDIYLHENLWLQIIPNLESNIIQLESTSSSSLASTSSSATKITLKSNNMNNLQTMTSDDDTIDTRFNLKFAYDLQQFTLNEYTEMWCNGQLSNYDYLIILNNAVGRRLNCPSYHHIMPWVTDFTKRNGEKWRDLTKSKYRLNKGDSHLDLMFTAILTANNNSNIDGNENLDQINDVPHHVSEFLSEITYYVYMARRTPKHILCQHVRPIWVPAEYPISIQRLQEWTPDECIPEFYSDPMVFKSIHEDLPDLELPKWATCPEDFISKHREALESQYVSERLHYWIDLNFGYKLTGKAAIRSKNVCLSLVDNHKNLIQKGIVQLFTHPHPSKRFPSIWFNKIPPRLSSSTLSILNEQQQQQQHNYHHQQQQRRRMVRSSEDLTSHSLSKHNNDFIDVTPSNSPRKSMNVTTNRQLSPSSTSGIQATNYNTNIPESIITTGNTSFGVNSGNIERSTSYHTNVHRSSNNTTIYLPKDFNPVSQLISLENTEIFCGKTYLNQKNSTTNNIDCRKERSEKFAYNDLMFDDSSDNSFTNRIFSEVYETNLNRKILKQNKNKNFIVENIIKHNNIKLLIKERHSKELQIVGCLIIELFLLHRLRPILMNIYNSTFDERLKCCKKLAKYYINEIPKCMHNAIKLLLNIEDDSTAINNMTSKIGIIQPTSHQILQLIFNTNSILPFPNFYSRIYSLITSLHNFEIAETLLDINTYFDCDGKQCSKFDDLDRKRVLFNRKIAECKVKAACVYVDGLLEPTGHEQFKAIELILPYIVNLLKCEETSILSAWLLFDSIATSLGIKDSQKYLLEPILRLYDADLSSLTTILQNHIKNNESTIKFTISSSFKSRKSVKLYHHSFLLRLIVRFGLKCFLENFISPLIEAVGGYKEPEESTGFHYHSNQYNDYNIRSSRSTKNLKFCCNEESDNSITLISQQHDDYCYSSTTEAVNNDNDGCGDGDGIQSDNTLSLQNSAKTEIEGIFTFENENDLIDDDGLLLQSSNDDNKFNNDNGGEPEIKSLDSFETRLSNLSAEEATEDLITTNTTSPSIRPQKLAIDDIINTGNHNNSVLSNNQNSNNRLSSNSSLDDEKISLNSQKDSPYKMTDNDDDDIDNNHKDGPIKSPTIPIPNTFRRNYELNTIDCEIGSRKSIDSIDLLRPSSSSSSNAAGAIIVTEKTKNDTKSSLKSINNDEPSDSLQASVISKISEARNSRNNNRLSEMSTESLIWLSHRLGPVLTARYLSRNLLKMLTLCYVGQENLLPDDYNNDNNKESEKDGNLNYFTVVDSIVVGDRNAFRVLECLTSIAALYGEQFVLLQYLPHFSELIALCKKRITPSLEGALISSLQLLKYLIPCLIDSTIMEQLQDVILGTIVHPIINLLGSTKCIMPSGFLARNVLARKLLDTIYIISVRIGPEMSKEHLCIPTLQKFFLIFDKAYGITNNFIMESPSSSSLKHQFSLNLNRECNISPPINLEELPENSEIHLRERAYEEIRDVFTPNLAHSSYIAFLKYLGESIMLRTIINLELILSLCHEYEQPNYIHNEHNQKLYNFSLINRRLSNQDEDKNDSNTFGTSVIGNRIEVTKSTIKHEMGPMEVLDMVAYKFDQINTSRHLRGNWLAYWEHEIGRSDKDNHLNLKQIKLQTFNGHTNTVRSILTLDNENSFMSASKDKTVKLWSLRSEGDGKKITSCQFTYNSHKKSVHSLAFLESMRYVISCDSGVHLWDPFIGRPIGILDSQTKYSPVSIVRTYPSPSPLVLAGTSESTVKIIDARTVSYVNEWKVTSTQNSIVRCLACAPSGNWLAVGLSSGSIIILDGRTGMMLGSFKATDGELLQMIAANDQQIISSSLDHSISVWNVHNNTLQYHLKQAPEPAHCLFPNGNELVFATPANRIGVYSNLSSSDGTYSITKLRSDTLKGVLTSLAVLPLNRMILTGNDNGNIVLLC